MRLAAQAAQTPGADHVHRRQFISATLGLIPLLGSAQTAFPSRTVRIVVPFPAGGSPDLIARLLAEKLGGSWGQSVIVENRAGASGGLGLQQVSQAPPDGYTLLMASTGPLTVNPAVNPAVGYNPLTDLAPIAMIGKSPLVLMVNNSVPAQNLRELLELARRQPGQLTYASAGTGNLTHLAAEMMKLQTKTDILHIPYKGTAEVKADVLGGRVSMFFDTVPAALPLIRAGQVRALAVTSAERSSSAPEIPTFAEAGVGSAFDVSGWFAVLGPKGLPSAIVERVNRDINAVLQMPEIRDQFRSWGIDVTVRPPAELSKLMSAELARWKDVVRQASIKTQ
jgi:tripartite-type tricarboxylate transporter receptor subunit TctC